MCLCGWPWKHTYKYYCIDWKGCIYIFKNTYVYTYTYMHITTNEQVVHTFEREKGGVYVNIWKGNGKLEMLLYYNIKK